MNQKEYLINKGIYDEEDELTDEELFAQVSDNKYNTEDSVEDAEEDAFKVADGEYKICDITERFLKYEISIQCESSRTEIKFSYRGDTFKGIVMQQMPTSKDDYIFYVQQIGKNVPADKKGKKMMKKIHIPDASLIC